MRQIIFRTLAGLVGSLGLWVSCQVLGADLLQGMVLLLFDAFFLLYAAFGENHGLHRLLGHRTRDEFGESF